MLLNKTLLSLLLFLILSFSGSKVLGQQDPQFTHNMFNSSFINPGSYGFSEGIAVTGIYRNQWLGFKDEEGNTVNPETFLVTADAPIRFLHGGVGIGIVQDKLGFTKNMGVKLGYSYHFNIGSGKIGIGINGDFNNQSNDFSKYITTEDSDPKLAGASSDGVMITDMAAGIFLKKPQYFLSFSTNKILESSKDLSGSSGLMYKNRRHYYVSYGHNLTFPAYQGFVFTPSIFLKSDGSTVQVDLNTIARYNNKVWGGVSYRLQDALCLMVGFVLKDVEIGYSFDVPTSGLSSKTFGSHEIMARYVFKIEREKVKSGYRNTRFL